MSNRLLFCLLFLLLGISYVHSKQIDAKYVHLLTGDIFFEYLHGSASPWFIQFYLPDCGYCAALAEVWADLSLNQFEKTNIGAVNCETDDPLCIIWDVNHVPSMIFVLDGMAYEYDGTRELDDLVKFIESDYILVEGKEIPTKDDYTEERAKEVWKKLLSEGKLPSASSVLIFVLILFLIVFVCCSYCCAPSSDENDELIELVDKKDEETDEEDKKETDEEKEETVEIINNENEDKSTTRKRKILKE